MSAVAFNLGEHRIEPGGRCFVIGEVAQAHDGSLGTAHAFIDAIAEAGADAVKFQTHIADAESTPAEPFRVPFSYQDATRYEYWRRMEFTEEQWHGLALHARERGLVFLSSPFSVEAIELLLRVGVPAWKIPSGEVDNTPLIERAIATGLPLLISSGMSSMSELDGLARDLRAADVPFLIFQCTTAYPCPPEKIGLSLLGEMRARYQSPVGLSDHSGTIFPGIAAVMGGLDALEVHVTLSRQMFGPDVPASVTPGELRQLVEGIRFVERCRDVPLDKDSFATDAQELRQIFGRSVVAATRLEVGTVLAFEHLRCKKPGGGIPPSGLAALIGRRLKRGVDRNDRISEADLE